MPSNTDSDGASSGQNVPDGQIDFAGYSDVQLQQLLLMLDRERYPLNALHLKQELNRRTAQPSTVDELAEAQIVRHQEPPEVQVGAGGETYAVRFTERDGWRG